MKRLLPIGVLVTGVTAFITSALPAFGADSATVNASVSVAAPCITVAPSSIAFGTVPFSTPATPSSRTVNGISFVNCGASSEFVLAHGTDAVGTSPSTATWDLAGFFACSGASGLNHYNLTLNGGNSGGANPTPGFSVNTVKTDQYLRLNGTNTVFAAGSAEPVDAYLTMPCAGSDGAGASAMNFNIVFTATF